MDFMSSRMPSRLTASSDCEWAAPRVETVRRWRRGVGERLQHVLLRDRLHHQPRPPVVDVAEVGDELVVGLGHPGNSSMCAGAPRPRREEALRPRRVPPPQRPGRQRPGEGAPKVGPAAARSSVSRSPCSTRLFMKDSGGLSSTRARISPAENVDAPIGPHAEEPHRVPFPGTLDAAAGKVRAHLGREGRLHVLDGTGAGER